MMEQRTEALSVKTGILIKKHLQPTTYHCENITIACTKHSKSLVIIMCGKNIHSFTWVFTEFKAGANGFKKFLIIK